MKPNHALNDLLRVAKMPRSTFYYQQVKHDYREIKETILLRYKKNRKRDGYRPMTLKLRQMGSPVFTLLWSSLALIIILSA